MASGQDSLLKPASRSWISPTKLLPGSKALLPIQNDTAGVDSARQRSSQEHHGLATMIVPNPHQPLWTPAQLPAAASVWEPQSLQPCCPERVAQWNLVPRQNRGLSGQARHRQSTHKFAEHPNVLRKHTAWSTLHPKCTCLEDCPSSLPCAQAEWPVALWVHPPVPWVFQSSTGLRQAHRLSQKFPFQCHSWGQGPLQWTWQLPQKNVLCSVRCFQSQPKTACSWTHNAQAKGNIEDQIQCRTSHTCWWHRIV